MRRYLSGNIRQRGGFWYARYRIPTGKDTSKKLGRVWKKREDPPPGYMTERQARRELDAILAKYEGWTPGSDPQFQFAAQEFLARCREKGLRGTTCSRYEGICREDLEPVLGEKVFSRIDEQMINMLRDDLSARLSPSSLNQTKVVLAGIVKHAQRTRRYRGEDFSKWFDPATIRPKLEIDVYSPAEVELLARTVREGKCRTEPLRNLSEFEIAERRRTDEQYAAIFKTAAYAGLRMSEIRALQWTDVDFAGEKITIRRGYTDRGGHGAPKSQKARTVPMAPQVSAELDQLSRRGWSVLPGDLVFCSALGEVLSASAIYRALQDAAETTGLRRMTFHSLRHAAATLMIQRFPVSDVQSMLGHANIQTTARYLHYVPRTESAAKLGGLISDSLDPLETAIEEVPER